MEGIITLIAICFMWGLVYAAFAVAFVAAFVSVCAILVGTVYVTWTLVRGIVKWN